jgi:hypothetical protein
MTPVSGFISTQETAFKFGGGMLDCIAGGNSDS